MATSTSSVSLQRSSPVGDSTEESPSSDLALKLDKHIEAADFSSAVNLLIFSLGQTDLTDEKEAIFAYLFTLLPHHDEKQYTQLCERLPRLLEVARDDSHNQSKLAQQLAERFLALTKELPLEQRIEYFISAQHFIAKAMKMEKDPIAIKKCHQSASRHFVTLIFEFLVKDRAFYDMVDEARRRAQADRVRAHVRQIEDLERFCGDEEDHKMIKALQGQAIEVANAKDDALQECFAPVFSMEGQPFSPPTCFSTERYQNALQTFRLQFDTLDPRDIRAAQKHHFRAFRTFFKELIDDILAITGPPPCGFDLRAMGSIGREEICPFSDLECMILISEDTLQVRKYFSLFVKILELQMASFGETPGALPFVFTCLRPPEVKGLYLDQSPRKDDRLITTPTSLADLQKELDSEGPTSIQHTVLRTRSLYATDPTLYDTYQEESRRVIDACVEDPLKQRALQHIEIRKKDYQEIWQHPFSTTLKTIKLKNQFMEPLFHILGDLALYDHVKETNTLDIIDALGDRFNVDSQKLINEAVSFLFQLRVDLQRFYSEQRDDLYFPPSDTLERVFTANGSIIDSLEKIFYLVIFPLYHVHALTSIRSLDLVSVAMTQVIADPSYTQNPKLLIPLIRQVALFLESIDAPVERHKIYYHHIGEVSKGEILQQAYLENLKNPSLIAFLAMMPNSVGFRQEKRMREEALVASLQAITSSRPVKGMQVQITAPCLESVRYLHPEFAKQILDTQGKIKDTCESKHRVTSLTWKEHKLHFKMWPTHPLMEYALYDLYYRIAGQLSPANTLARFTVIKDGKTREYPVLISETIDHPTISKQVAEGDLFSNIDKKQWSWLILCSILVRLGDGRLSNYVISKLGKIFSIDNDIAFVFPTQESLLFSQINFACALFFLSKHPMVLDPEVLREFSSLDFDLIFPSWLEEVIAKEKEYNSLFNAESRPVVLEVPKEDLRDGEEDSFTSSILFSPGSILACRLQANKLKTAITKAETENAKVFCFDLLKEFISLRTDLPIENTKVGERIFRAYVAAQKQPTVATRYATAIGRKAASSLTMAEFKKVSFQTPPSKKEIEEAAYSPKEALKELLIGSGQTDDQVSYTTSTAGHHVLQGHFAHLRSAAGPNILRQELVLKYVAHLLEDCIIKPRCVVLRDCAVLNRRNLLPFLHPNLRILDLKNSPQIDSRCLVDIAAMCPQLEELYLSRAKIGAFPPALNFSFVQFPKLRILQITKCPRLTSLKINAPQLEYLNLSSNPELQTLLFVANSFPKIDFEASPIVPLVPAGNLEKMIVSENGLFNAAEFYKEIFWNFIEGEEDLTLDADDITFFEYIEKERSLVLEELIESEVKETPRQQLLDAASLLYKRLTERLRSLTDDVYPSLPPLEKEWLNICIYLYPDEIPTYFLDEWLKSEHPKENVLEKRSAILAALSKDRAFLLYDSSTETFSVPQRIREFVKDTDKHISYGKACRLLIRLWDQIDFDDIRDWEKDSAKAKELLTNSDFVMSDPRFEALSSEDQAKFYTKTAETKYLQGKYREALEKHQKALEIQRKSLDSNHPDIATSLNSIGNCLVGQGKYQEALEKHERALEIQEKSLNPNHPDIAKSIRNIGHCLLFQGKNQEALEKYEEALEIWQKILDPNHPNITRSIINIGLCFQNQEALEKLVESFKILQKVLDPNHPDIAKSLSNIGSCLRAQGRDQEALEKYEEALEIQQKSLDSNHPDIAKSLSNIGSCLDDQDKNQEALEKHQKALEIRQKSLNPNHPDIAKSLCHIGICLYSQEKFQKAKEKFEEALEIQGRFLDPDGLEDPKIIMNPDFAKILWNIERCLKAQGEHKEALEMHERVLETRLEVLDFNDSDDDLSPLEKEWLCLCAYFNPDSIPQYFLEEWVKSEHPEENVLEKRDSILAILSTEQSFLKYDSSTKTFSIPRRFQEIIKKKDGHPFAYDKVFDLLIRLWDQIDFDDIRNWEKDVSKAEELLVHSVLVMDDPKFKAFSREDQAKFYTKMAETKYLQGEYQEALEKHERALEMRSTFLDPDHPDIARSLNHIGNCLYFQGKYHEALEKHQRALEIRQKSLDPNHPDIAQSLNNIGNILYSQGKHQEAIEKYQKALGIWQKSLDSKNLYIATSINNIGECLYAQSKSQEALKEYQKALEIREKSLDHNHPDIARSLDSIGTCLHSQGKYQEALERHERALKIRQRIFKPEHPDIAVSLKNIGICLFSQGKFREALKKHERALEIQQKSFKSDHFVIAVTLDEIGNCFHAQGKYREALEKYKKALQIRQKSLDPNHPDIAKSLNFVGSCLERQGKYQKALEKYQKALEIREKSLDPNHRDIVQILDKIGACYSAQGKYQEALETHQRSLEIEQKSLDPNHPNIVASLDKIGACYSAQGKYQEALETHQRSLEIEQKSLDPNHPDIVVSLSNIGGCLKAQGKNQEALEKFKETLEISRKSLDPNHPGIAISLSNIGYCLYSQGKYQEALEKFEEALEIRKKSLDPNHPDIAESLKVIGRCLYFQKKYKEAFKKMDEGLEILQKSLETLEKSLDPNHPDIVTRLIDIGDHFSSRAKYKKASERYARVLKIQRRSLDPKHPDIAKSLEKIGECFLKRNKWKKALEFYQEALKIWEKSFRTNQLNIANCLDNIGRCLETIDFYGGEAKDKYKSAFEKYESALEIRRKWLDPYHPDIVKSLYNIGNNLRSQGKPNEALEKYERALEIQRQSHAPDYVKSLNGVGIFLFVHKCFQEALKKFEEVLEIRRKSLDPLHPDIAQSLFNIGSCFLSQAQYDIALEKYQTALDIWKKSLENDDNHIVTTLDHISKCRCGIQKGISVFRDKDFILHKIGVVHCPD